MSSHAHELLVARKAVRAAGRVCARVQSGITPETLEKKDKSPVTVADFASQAVVCRALKVAFPDDPVIAEEDAAELRADGMAEFRDRVTAAVNDPVGIAAEGALEGFAATTEETLGWIDHGGASEYSGRFWTLDPIDGTKGFLRGGQYAVSLALVVDGVVTVGAVACPNLPHRLGGTGTVFLAARGGGCEAVPLDAAADLQAAERVTVTTTEDPSAARFCESVESGHSDHDASAQIAATLGITAEPARMDSQAKYCAVARGEADIYLRLPTRPGYVERIWDHAGGTLVITEAGGTVTDVDGKPLEFTHGSGLSANRGVVVTNGPLHGPVLEAVAAAGV